MIREVRADDAKRICAIYNYYVANTIFTFDVDPQQESEVRLRIDDIVESGYPYYVYEYDGKVVGYCCLHGWIAGCRNKTTTEITLYVDNDFRGKGIGVELMDRVLSVVDKNKYHSVISAITSSNEASIALHKKFGFEQVSHFREMGYKFGQWHDVIHWQLIL